MLCTLSLITKTSKHTFHLQSSTQPCCCLLQSCETKPEGLCRPFPNRVPVPKPYNQQSHIYVSKDISRLKFCAPVDNTACQISEYNNFFSHSPWWVWRSQLPSLSSLCACCWHQTSTTWQHSWSWFCFFYVPSFKFKLSSYNICPVYDTHWINSWIFPFSSFVSNWLDALASIFVSNFWNIFILTASTHYVLYALRGDLANTYITNSGGVSVYMQSIHGGVITPPSHPLHFMPHSFHS